MQVKINPLSARTGPVADGDKKGTPLIEQDFISAIKAAGIADTSNAITESGIATHECEIDPVELYQSATGRAIEKSEPSPEHWTDEIFSDMVGNGAEINTTKSINWESKGDKQLTEEQIAQLKKKYDVRNLSPQDYYNLMSDLTQMNVLSGEDCKGAHLSHTGISGQGFRFRPAGVPSLIRRFRTGDMTKFFETALENLLKNLAWIESDEYLKANGITEEERSADLEAVKKDIHTRQTMLDLMKQLQ